MTTLNDFFENKEPKKEIVSEKPKVKKVEEKKIEEKVEIKKEIRIESKPVKKIINKIPWTKKYTPQIEKDFIYSNKDTIKKFISNYSKQKKKGLILWGPSGTGKSCSVYAFADELGLEVIELNASDNRNKGIIEELLGNAINQQSLFGSGKIILVDDVDGLSGFKDRGAAPAIVKLMKNSKFPIIFTCQDAYSKKISSLRSKCQLLEFKHMSEENIKEKLKEILKLENITFSESDLDVISKNSNGDLRAAINDSQMLSIGSNKLNIEILSELDKRLQNSEMKDAIKQIFKSNDPKSVLGVFDTVKEDFDQSLIWLDENMPVEYTSKIDRARAYGCLTKANVYMRRIRRRQHWRFLVYVNALLTAGVCSAKTKPYVNYNNTNNSYKQGSRILKLWQANIKYAKRKAIAAKIAKATHTSTKEIIKNFEYYKIIFMKNKDMSSKISNELDLDKEESEYLAKV